MALVSGAEEIVGFAASGPLAGSRVFLALGRAGLVGRLTPFLVRVERFFVVVFRVFDAVVSRGVRSLLSTVVSDVFFVVFLAAFFETFFAAFFVDFRVDFFVVFFAVRFLGCFVAIASPEASTLSETPRLATSSRLPGALGESSGQGEMRLA